MKHSEQPISKETIDDLSATPLVIIARRIAQLEEENEALKDAALRLVGGWVESGDGATDKALEDMRNLLRAQPLSGR